MYMKYLVRVTSTAVGFTVIMWLLPIVTFFYLDIFIFWVWVSSIVPQPYRLLTGSTTGFYKQQRRCTINSNPVTGPQCTFFLVTVALWIQCSIFSYVHIVVYWGISVMYADLWHSDPQILYCYQLVCPQGSAPGVCVHSPVQNLHHHQSSHPHCDG